MDYRHYIEIFKTSLGKFVQDDGPARAGNMAFWAMLSLFPFLIFLIAVSGLMGQTERGVEAIQFMMEALPPEVVSVLDGPIEGVLKNTRPEILTGSILFAIWTAANGVEAARHSLLVAFGREHAPAMWARKLENLAVVILGALLVIITMSIMVVGPAAFKAAFALLPEVNLDINFDLSGIYSQWKKLNLLVSPLILLTGIYGVYLALTPRAVKGAYRLPGAILSLIVLIATAKGLSLYLRYAGNYDVMYGSLAGVMITQLFCFIISIGFILGAEVNAVWTRKSGTKQHEKEAENANDGQNSN